MFTERVGRYTIAPPRAAGPTEKNKEIPAGKGELYPKFPPRGIAAAAYAKNMPLAHFLNAAAPGGSAEVK